MRRVVRVGVIGAGANSKLHHIPKLQAIAGVNVVGVCNRTRQSGDRVADEFAIPQVYADWEAMVTDDVIDAIVIGTWPYTHCRMACAALDAGKHVLCEARMAMNAAEAHRMLEASRAHPDLTAQIVPSPMTLEFDRTIERLVREGALGDLYAIDVHGAGREFVDAKSALTWRQDVGLSGLNILSMGIWYEALARWIGHATRVAAFTRVFIDRRPDDTGVLRSIEVPDHVDVLADFNCGAQGHLRFSAVTGACPAPSCAFLYGRDATLKLDVGAGVLSWMRRGKRAFSKIAIPSEEAQGWRVEEEFIGAIRGEEEIRLTSFAEGVKYMEFTEAVSRSARTGQAVSLPLT